MRVYDKHVNIFAKDSNKSKFKSLFLDRYDNHFTSLYYMWYSKTMSSLMLAYSPDAVKYQKYSSDVSPNLQIFSATTQFGGASASTTLRRETLVRLMYAIRSRNSQIQEEDLLTANRLYGNGYIRTGRAILNTSRRLRWGSRWNLVTRVRNSILLNEEHVATVSNDQRRRFFKIRGGFGNNAGGFLSRKYDYWKLKRAQRERITVFLVSAVHFLKTIWYQTNKHLEAFRLPEVGRKSYGYPHVLRIHGFARTFKNVSPETPAYNYAGWHSGRMDLEISQVPIANAWRRRFRHHNWRIHVGRFEKKFWGIKKTRQFWGFMRWFSHFVFRGVWGYKIYNQRIDLFIVNHLRVRNLVFARALVTNGHAFIGHYACKNPAQYISNCCVVSLSREAYNWNATFSGYVAVNHKIGRRRAAPVTFARPSNWGYMRDHKCRFVLPYGDHVDLILGERGFRVKSNWAPNSYFHFQRLACAAWW